MEAAAKGDDAWATRMGAGDLDGVLDSFGPRAQQHGLLDSAARRHGIELFCQLHIDS